MHVGSGADRRLTAPGELIHCNFANANIGSGSVCLPVCRFNKEHFLATSLLLIPPVLD
jgi:hypothetical protein